jgi:uncharacterized protein
VSHAIYMLINRPSLSFSGLAGSRLRSGVGFVGGLVGGFTAMPGALPVMWCELRGVSREQQRGVVQPFIPGMQVLAMVMLASRPGTIRGEVLQYTLLAMPAWRPASSLACCCLPGSTGRDFARRRCGSCSFPAC